MTRQTDEKIKFKILALLDQHRIMTIATLRRDDWPQATTVGYEVGHYRLRKLIR